MSMFETEMPNAASGFRLHAVEILNWGTFHGKVWRLEAHGQNSLLTGDVGSGKSTLVDALTCLIVPHQKISFNKAAGAEKNERNLTSYIKGEYKNTKNDDSDTTRERSVTLRYNDAKNVTFSVILANFTNDHYHDSVALAQVFWIENDKVQKLLIIREKEPLSIKDHFSDIEDPRELRKRLKGLPNTEMFDENFSRYSQRFRYLFGMQTDKAIDLFNQTVSMKSVSSLTFFVREQMLERTEIKGQIEDLKKRFDDLNKAFAAVQEARLQRDTLAPLVESCGLFQKLEEEITEMDAIVSAVPGYFSRRKIALLETELEDGQRKLLQINGQLSSLEDILEKRRDSLVQIRQDIRNNGGERLEKITEEIQQRTKSSEVKRAKQKEYADLASFCQLETANTDKTFFRNLKNAELKSDALRLRQDEVMAENGKLTAQSSGIRENLDTHLKELASLKQRKNSIPLEFLTIRQQLANALGIDEDAIPFAGELMKVHEGEKEWEGALERLLRGFGISMLVPEQHYQQVSHYINQKRLLDNRNRGMRLDYFKVAGGKQGKFRIDIDEDSVVNKIVIKSDSAFEPWIQSELERRFNLRCVTLQEFQRMPGDVITAEGQYKVGNQRHTKDDRRDLWDRLNFVLGWTNQEKIKAIETHILSLELEKAEFDTKIAGLNAENREITVLQSRLAQVIAYKNWQELNWKEEMEFIARLEVERSELSSSNNILTTLQRQLDVAIVEIKENESAREQLTLTKGSLNDRIENYTEEIIVCRNATNMLSEVEIETYFPRIEAALDDKSFNVRNIDRTRESFLQEKNKERIKSADRQARARDRIINTMREYKEKFPAESLELSDEIAARSEYLEKLKKILHEGLPAHEETLKTMLNKNTIDDIVAFDNKLDIHEKEIRNKIRNINQHLREIEFNKGTYIELIADRNRDQDIKIFKEDLKACYSNILDTSDAYTEDRFNDVQKILNRFRSNENRDTEWTNKVTDVRNWFDFNASEKYIETNEEKEFYSGSSGKSGGQKEKLAYTIIASALAYQFGLGIGGSKSKSFRFAVIDEAFGKGSDASAEYGLELFKKLNLQLLIVTPLQKIHVIENYISTVHYVSNVEGNNSELQNMTIEEFKTTKQLKNLAASGIEVVPSL
ncbi:MAG: ATP-binding protein [Chryseolinea sp.]